MSIIVLLRVQFVNFSQTWFNFVHSSLIHPQRPNANGRRASDLALPDRAQGPMVPANGPDSAAGSDLAHIGPKHASGLWGLGRRPRPSLVLPGPASQRP